MPDMLGAADGGVDQGLVMGSTLVAKRFGGAGNESGQALATDAAGNVYLTGQMLSTLNLGGGLLEPVGSDDFFVAKYDANGTHLWSKRFGGPGSDFTNAIALDKSGNVWVTGSFDGASDYGGGLLTSAGATDAFLLSLGADGSFRSAQRYGSVNAESATGLAVASDGSIALTGGFLTATDFGVGMHTSSGNADGYLLKLSPTGLPQWSKSFGSTNVDTGSAVQIAANGDVVLAGYFAFEANLGGTLLTAPADDILIARFDAAGLHKWSRSGGARGRALNPALALDPMGNVFVAAMFTEDFSLGGAIFSSNGGTDAIVGKLSAMDGGQIWSQRIGGGGTEFVFGLASDADGNVAVTGTFNASLFFDNNLLINTFGAEDTYVVKFDGSGRQVFVRQFGGPATDRPNDVVADPQGNLWVTGHFYQFADFGTGRIASLGGADLFLTKLKRE